MWSYEADDLAGGMHSSIRPACCRKISRIRLDASQGMLDRILDCEPIGLGLETLEEVPRIGNAQCQMVTQDARLSSKERASSR